MQKRDELSLTDMALHALREAVAKVVEEQRREGKPLAVWRDGKAVLIPATEIGSVHETPTRHARKKGAKGIVSNKQKNKENGL